MPIQIEQEEEFEEEFAIDEPEHEEILEYVDNRQTEDELLFKKKLNNLFSSSVKKMGGYSSFLTYLSGLPEEEREGIFATLQDRRITGNRLLEAEVMLAHALPFAVSEYFDAMQMVNEPVMEVVQQAHKAVENLAYGMQYFVTELKRASDSALAEVEASKAKAKSELVADFVMLQAQLEEERGNHVRELEAQKERLLIEIEAAKDKVEVEINAVRMKVRSSATEKIAKEIEKEASKAFKRVENRYSFNNLAFNIGSIIAGLALFTIASKFFH